MICKLISWSPLAIALSNLISITHCATSHLILNLWFVWRSIHFDCVVYQSDLYNWPFERYIIECDWMLEVLVFTHKVFDFPGKSHIVLLTHCRRLFFSKPIFLESIQIGPLHLPVSVSRMFAVWYVQSLVSLHWPSPWWGLWVLWFIFMCMFPQDNRMLPIYHWSFVTTDGYWIEVFCAQLIQNNLLISTTHQTLLVDVVWI